MSTVSGTVVARYRQYASEITAVEAQYPRLAQYPGLLAGVLAHESGFVASAISPKNANGTVDQGIAQLNSAYYPASTALNATSAIQTAAQILNSNLGTCGSVQGALYKYNSGSCSGVASDTTYPQQVLAYANAIRAATGQSRVSYGSPSGTTAAGGVLGGMVQHAGSWVLVGLGVAGVIVGLTKF